MLNNHKKEYIMMFLGNMNKLYSLIENSDDYHKNIESRTIVSKNFMDHQKEISPKLRTNLIEWMEKIRDKFNLLPATLFLSVNIVDRYIEKKSIKRLTIPLLGITALFMASKYEEVSPPTLSNYIYISSNDYSYRKIKNMEIDILNVLDNSILYISPDYFFETLKKDIILNGIELYIYYYILELSILYHTFSSIKSSIISSSTIILTKLICNENDNINNYIESILKNINCNIEDIISYMLIQIEYINEAKNKKRYPFVKYCETSKYDTLPNIYITKEQKEKLTQLKK